MVVPLRNGLVAFGSKNPRFPEKANRQLATGNWQLATGNWQLATGNWQLATLPRSGR
jgi:hypothetical protein